jgi:hypothetical protein
LGHPETTALGPLAGRLCDADTQHRYRSRAPHACPAMTLDERRSECPSTELVRSPAAWAASSSACLCARVSSPCGAAPSSAPASRSLAATRCAPLARPIAAPAYRDGASAGLPLPPALPQRSKPPVACTPIGWPPAGGISTARESVGCRRRAAVPASAGVCCRLPSQPGLCCARQRDLMARLFTACVIATPSYRPRCGRERAPSRPLACSQDTELQAIASALFECRQAHHTPQGQQRLCSRPPVSVPLHGFWFAAQSATESSSRLYPEPATGPGKERICKRPELSPLATRSSEHCSTPLCFVARLSTPSSALIMTGWLAVPVTKTDAGKALRSSLQPHIVRSLPSPCD